MLTSCSYFGDYVDAVLLDERSALTVDVVYEFLSAFFPKVSARVLSEQTLRMIDNTVVSLSEQVGSFDILKMAKRLSGDLRALILVYNSPEAVPPPLLLNTLRQLQSKIKQEIGKLDNKKVCYSRNEQTDMLLTYGECQNNAVNARMLYAVRYPLRRQPSGNFTKLEMMPRKDRAYQNHIHFIVSEEAETNVLAYVHFSPFASVRELEIECGISRESAREVLEKHKYRYYKYGLHQHLCEK
ncbi:hypothetical protein JTB14_016020 [Gonioctena quinquepunctata]|nr:hypothetical protein JTB14_016020 [Gonioctena quinquepunctata]